MLSLAVASLVLVSAVVGDTSSVEVEPVCDSDDISCNVGQIVKTLDLMDKKMNNLAVNMYTKVDGLGYKMHKKINDLEDRIDKRINRLENGMDTKMVKMEKRMENIEDNIADMNNQMTRINRKINKLEENDKKMVLHFTPDTEDMKHAVINEENCDFRCKMTLVENDSQLFLVSSLHCLIGVNSESRYFVDVWKNRIPEDMFDAVTTDCLFNIENDLVLIGLDKNKITTLHKYNPILLNSHQNSYPFSCDVSKTSRLVCCCSFDCKLKFYVDINYASANYVRGSELFIKGESGCICKDATVKTLGTNLNENQCLYVNSHRANEEPMPDADEFADMMTCMQYRHLFSVIDVSQKSKCNKLTRKYHSKIQHSVFNWVTNLGVLDMFRINTFKRATLRPVDNADHSEKLRSFIIDARYNSDIQNAEWYVAATLEKLSD